ncbi:DUF1799 domain-containing protein [Xenorhabdus bovienii]|uniref:Phage protein n=1 Tax=Xenorhabdus bovienii str. kraussei Becker Underwood TaxID=1398204 RepID=A0A077PQ83_XENBV|nr:DUF1799 domain-containing protein [Xenorhabdus bovienii]CDH23188.1 hypothetical protein XBKB1_1540012 [Xenorhabdus bovienii str. kraussei Becker Underwood]
MGFVSDFQCNANTVRVGMNGATGLDYSPLNQVMDYLNIKDRATVFNDIRVMEVKALEVMHKK